jgi:enediyne biosynthesis protein E4
MSQGNMDSFQKLYFTKQRKWTYEDITIKYAPDLANIGMVKSAAWVDLDQDGKMDLVVVGEWMPISILMNREGKLVNETDKFGLANTSGWWNTVEIGDLNGDGFPDLVLGNLGLNSRLKASKKLLSGCMSRILMETAVWNKS